MMEMVFFKKREKEKNIYTSINNWRIINISNYKK